MRTYRGGWQERRLKGFASFEEEQVKDLEYLCSLNGTKLTYRELVLILFFQRREYVQKPGSLMCLYRVWKSEEAEGVAQNKRYELYYQALMQGGYL